MTHAASDDEVIEVLSLSPGTSVATIRRSTTEDGNRVVTTETFFVDLNRGVFGVRVEIV